MSRTNKTTASNPATKFLSWKSSKEAFVYWDKEAQEEKVFDTASAKFVYLDSLSTLTGYSDKHNAGMYSNEVRSTTHIFKLYAGKTLIKEGTYEQLKGDAKFAKSVYALCYTDEGESIVNFKLSGASVSSWFNFCENVGKSIESDLAFSVVGVEQGKKGAVKYTYPVFGVVESDDIDFDLATEADKNLQEYLRAYFSKEDEPEIDEIEENEPPF